MVTWPSPIDGSKVVEDIQPKNSNRTGMERNWIGIVGKAGSFFSFFSIVKRSVLFCFVLFLSF